MGEPKSLHRLYVASEWWVWCPKYTLRQRQTFDYFACRYAKGGFDWRCDLVFLAKSKDIDYHQKSDLVFLAKSKDIDYHQKMNSVVFLEWFENQLMPALKNPNLVVLICYIMQVITMLKQKIRCAQILVRIFSPPKLSYTIQHSLFCYWYQKSIIWKNKTKKDPSSL